MLFGRTYFAPSAFSQRHNRCLLARHGGVSQFGLQSKLTHASQHHHTILDTEAERQRRHEELEHKSDVDLLHAQEEEHREHARILHDIELDKEERHHAPHPPGVPRPSTSQRSAALPAIEPIPHHQNINITTGAEQRPPTGLSRYAPLPPIATSSYAPSAPTTMPTERRALYRPPQAQISFVCCCYYFLFS